MQCICCVGEAATSKSRTEDITEAQPNSLGPQAAAVVKQEYGTLHLCTAAAASCTGLQQHPLRLGPWTQ